MNGVLIQLKRNTEIKYTFSSRQLSRLFRYTGVGEIKLSLVIWCKYNCHVPCGGGGGSLLT